MSCNIWVCPIRLREAIQSYHRSSLDYCSPLMWSSLVLIFNPLYLFSKQKLKWYLKKTTNYNTLLLKLFSGLITKPLAYFFFYLHFFIALPLWHSASNWSSKERSLQSCICWYLDLCAVRSFPSDIGLMIPLREASLAHRFPLIIHMFFFFFSWHRLLLYGNYEFICL